jgi:hypothetical protein
MAQPSTCGEGLAQNSLLPTKLGELAASMADVLEAHVPALDLEDENARKEHEGELLSLLQQRLEADRSMLGGTSAGSSES